MSQPFTHLLRVRYADCDAQHVVFNAKYVEYIDVAATEFMRATWGNYRELSGTGVDTQVVNVNVAWTAPATFDDVIAISVQSSHIGNTAYTLKLTFTNHATGLAIAKAEIVYVTVDNTEYKKVMIPDDLRESLERGAPGVLVDHAGVS